MKQTDVELRTFALPRLAGRLTFMRSQFVRMDELRPDNLAVLGIPFEGKDEGFPGYRYAPLGIRETSVYYGWFSNPQFKSAPIDVVSRKVVDTGCINEKLVDIGDISISGLSLSAAEEKITSLCAELEKTRAASIVLSGHADSVYSVCRGLAGGKRLGYVQLGGELPVQTAAGEDSSVRRLWKEGLLREQDSLFIAPLANPTAEFAAEFLQSGGTLVSLRAAHGMGGNYRPLFGELKSRTDAVVAVLDLSAFDSSLHGAIRVPRFNGLSLIEVQNLLIALGQLPAASIVITGLNPTVNGLGIVKTAQRMLVTAILKYIYARVGLLGPEEVVI